jgi:hypothetical protein
VPAVAVVAGLPEIATLATVLVAGAPAVPDAPEEPTDTSSPQALKMSAHPASKARSGIFQKRFWASMERD